jgi:Zn-dependent protease with chaperone function
MDFFDRQDKARRNTKVLVFYFVVAVALLVLATYTALALAFFAAGLRESAGQATFHWWEPELFLWATLGTLAVILIGSISKTLELSGGGSAVAEMLDGRLLDSNTTEPDERRLLNVVEEMAIASGVPVPQVYVMDAEAGINAFAAGHSPSDAAIGATRGCMKLLSRDELQGVIGHEFSHILNGDMRLNLRLMGLIFGILCLTVVGRILVRTRGRKNPMPLLGLALIVIGWAGVFFGRLIQAAVSRQREVLADASAAQFTRNPQGLASALKKIGGLAQGSRMESAHAEEAGHLFFANGLSDAFFGLMATHPPLEERIRALDPEFDGKFPALSSEAPPDVEPPEAKPLRTAGLPFPGFPAMQSATGGFVAPVIAAQSVIQNVGRPTARHLRYAEDLHQAVPPSLTAAARDPLGAGALLYALLLSNDSSARQTQLGELAQATSAVAYQETMRIWPETQSLAVQAKIPLVDLAVPALRRLSQMQFQEFRTVVKSLSESDNKINLFEYMLQKIVLRHLEPYFLSAPKPVMQFYALRPLAAECGLLLSAMAYAGQEDATQAHVAFERGAQLLRHAAQTEIPFLPPTQCDLPQVDTALERLSRAVPQIKKNLLSACVETLATDGVIQEGEAELLRAIAEALDCPIPPFVQAHDEAERA